MCVLIYVSWAHACTGAAFALIICVLVSQKSLDSIQGFSYMLFFIRYTCTHLHRVLYFYISLCKPVCNLPI